MRRIKEMARGAKYELLDSTAELVWCTMTGCGISGEVLDNVPEQVKSFLMIHIYLTVRKILFEMGGIQSESALPGDPTFSQISNNNYDMPSFKRICAELESYQEMTSASKEVTITVSDLFSFMCHLLVMRQISNFR